MKKLLSLILGVCITPGFLLAQDDDFNPFGTTRAIVIGVSDYENDNIKDLRYAHSDADLFYQYLTSEAGGKVPQENIRILTNEDATWGEVLTSLIWLKDESKKGDQAIIYFSGHGDVENEWVTERGFLLLHEAPSSNYMQGGTLNLSDLEAVLFTLASKGVMPIFIADACRSGSLDRSTYQVMNKEWEGVIKILSSENEASQEGDKWNGGVFTYYLIKGMSGLADHEIIGNRDQKVMLRELATYVQVKVQQETVNQRPVVVNNADFPIAVVHPQTLASLIEDEDHTTGGGGNTYFASRGSNDLEHLPAEIKKRYDEFLAAIEAKELIYPASNSAVAIYEELLQNEKAETLHYNMRLKLISALEDKTARELKSMMEEKEADQDQEYFSYYTAESELAKALELLGEDNFYYNSLKAKHLYAQAVIAKWEGDIEQAKQLLKECIKLEPGAAYAYNELGVIYNSSGAYDEAIDLFVLARRMAPRWSFPLNNMGISYHKRGMSDSAIANYALAIQYNPTRYYGYYNTAIVYYDQGMHDSAIHYNLKSIAADPTHQNSYYNLGLAYYEKGELDKAEEQFLKVLSLDKTDHQAYTQLGKIAAKRKDFTQAEIFYKKVVDMEPAYYDVHILLGAMYDDNGDAGKAKKCYENAHNLKPENAWLNYTLANIWHNEQNQAKAEVYLQHLKKQAENEDALYYLGYYYQYTLDDDATSLPYYKKLAILNPDYELLNYNIASAYYNQGDYESAIPYYEKQLIATPEQYNSNYYLASSWYSLNKPEAAQQYFQKAVELEPENSEARYYLANNYLLMEQFDSATHHLLKVVSLQPDFGDAWYYLGNAYYNVPDYQKAVEAYLESLKFKPENQDAYYNAGYTYLYFLEDYDAAIDQFELLLKLNPQSADAMYNIGLAYQEKEQYKQALKWLNKTVQLQPSYRASLLDDYGYIHLRLKKQKEALEYFNENVVEYPLDPWSYYHLACFFSITEDTSKGIEFLEKALQKGFDDFEHIAADTDLQNLRNNKDYNALLARYAKIE